MKKRKKEIKIGIIGGTGQMGQWFKRFFEKSGYKVLIASRKTKLMPIECAKTSDVVIVTVPIAKTAFVIKQIGPYVRKDALFMDLTSLKEKPIKAMLKYSKASVIGTHPVFGPSVKSIKNQTVVLCRGRGNGWFSWLKNMLEKNGAKVRVTTAKKHDKMMSIIQGITHFSTIAVGHALKDMGIDIKDTLHYTSPIYKLRMDMVGRILNQDPELYADIEISNPQTLKSVNAYIKSTNILRNVIKKKDKKAFIRFFNKASKHLGRFKNEASEYSDYLIEKLVEKRR